MYRAVGLVPESIADDLHLIPHVGVVVKRRGVGEKRSHGNGRGRTMGREGMLQRGRDGSEGHGIRSIHVLCQ